MANRLADETSPYLKQHQDNPVDWYPWGAEAFAAARERDVPIFVSVGYSACHWCHVMAHESFEDEQVAAQLNEAFVNVKVDREERPDVDAVHMAATQALTGHGGWPMSVWLTPDGRPFHAGTYFPREPRHGMPSFPQVIEAVVDAWTTQREKVTESADTITARLANHRELEPADTIDVAVADEAAEVVLTRAWDRRLGGFGRAPKFPQAMTISWLLHRHARTGDVPALEAATQALIAMARGGIHDQLAGGFARYATDAAWLVPHFEKMLYDNALLLPAYAEAATLARDERTAAELARVARATAHYLLTDLRTDDGVFVAATDADSEGVEGRYFVWPYDELVAVLEANGHDPDLWTAFLGARPAGNWEGTNILHEPVDRATFAAERGLTPEEFDGAYDVVRADLLAHRATRVPPGVDDKVLTSWNALAALGLVRAGRLLDEPTWVEAAATCLDRLHEVQVDDEGALRHTSSVVDGQRRATIPAFLEDLATLALADLAVLGATGEGRWYDRALALAEDADARFHDRVEGGWFQTPDGADDLYTRPKDTWDNATPAGSSVLIEVALQLAGLSGDLVWRDRAEEGVRAFLLAAGRMPTGYGWLLRQVEALAAGPREVAIVGPPGPARDALVREATRTVRPGVVVVVADEEHAGTVPLLAHRGEVDGAPAAYVCRDLTCDRPVTTPEDLAVLLEGS
ncbi:thioredoxin domain-containing protein [Nitriliruptor alkaliphilus]|uniref:thioredoxin domain-containing protein n=1 Tax=Nitriliruptor alkaliphilus TaxID=427918 RepID=UPI0006977694|nr:thioredoxin domain-containing protein [Nitriliruptor alkaliphilus]